MKHFSTEDQQAFLSLPHFTERHFMLTEGDHAGKLMDLSLSPWLLEPMGALTDWSVETVTIWKATQSAGTTLAEAFLAYTMAFQPQNVLFQAPKRDKARAQSDRILRKLERIRLIDDIVSDWLVDRIKGNAPPFFLRLQGATEDNAQSDTAGMLLNDELWLWPKGILEMFRNRQGAVTFKKEINVTSAAETSSDADIEFRRGTQREYFLRCQNPKCEELIWPLWGKRSAKVYNGHQVFQWDSGDFESVRLVCPHCEHQHHDRPGIRERLALDGAYKRQNPDAPATVESFRWNGFVPYWRRWSALVEKWHQAIEEQRDGRGHGNLRVFILTTLVEPFDQVAPDQAEAAYSGDFSFEPHDTPWSGNPVWHGPEWEKEATRVMSVDVGIDHFWVVIRLVAEDWTTRLHYAGRIIGGWDQLDAIQAHFGVKTVFVDVGTFVEELQEAYWNIARRKWWGLEGADQDKGFPWKFEMPIPGGSKKFDELRMYSRIIERPTVRDRKRWLCNVVRWSNWMVKCHVYGLRNGKFGYWGVPDNHHVIPGKPTRSEHRSEYEFQLDAERIVEKIQPDGTKKQYWKRHTRNHYWDCECMIHVALTILKDRAAMQKLRTRQGRGGDSSEAEDEDRE